MAHQPPDADALAALAQKMIAVMREEGVPGNIAYDAVNGRILNESTEAIPLGGLIVAWIKAPAGEQDDVISRYVKIHLRGRQEIETWAEARALVLPRVRPEVEHVTWGLRTKLEGGTVPVLPTAPITEHLRGQFGWEVDGAFVPVQAADVERWGVSLDELQDAALENLGRRTPSPTPWLTSPESPGVYRSKWRDGFDATRAVFLRALDVPVMGPLVALATSDSDLFVADSTDEDALFQLGLAGNRALERDMSMVWLWPLLLEGEQRRHWLPAETSGAFAPLSFCAAKHAQLVYGTHGPLLQRVLNAEGLHAPVGEVGIYHTPLGAAATVAAWEDAAPAVVAEADVVDFRRDGRSLGIAPLQRVREVVGHLIEEIPGYPKRFRAHMFPEDWQLTELGISPT